MDKRVYYRFNASVSTVCFSAHLSKSREASTPGSSLQLCDNLAASAAGVAAAGLPTCSLHRPIKPFRASIPPYARRDYAAHAAAYTAEMQTGDRLAVSPPELSAAELHAEILQQLQHATAAFTSSAYSVHIQTPTSRKLAGRLKKGSTAAVAAAAAKADTADEPLSTVFAQQLQTLGKLSKP